MVRVERPLGKEAAIATKRQMSAGGPPFLLLYANVDQAIMIRRQVLVIQICSLKKL